MTTLQFWNGNKSAVRQAYELSLLQRVLNICPTEHAGYTVIDDRTDFPRAEDEGNIFNKDFDLCVTVAGNPKFTEGSFIPVYDPIMDGLLGHRLLVIREDDQAEFSGCKTTAALQQKMMGIPETWADAPLFRDNGYRVSEKGSFDELFGRLKSGECDYVSLGANEIFAVFAEKAAPLGGLVIESTLRLYYPYALVFYVNPARPELADSLAQGLQTMRRSGEFHRLFQSYFRQLFVDSGYHQRTEIQLQNPALPESLVPRMNMAAQELKRWATDVSRR